MVYKDCGIRNSQRLSLVDVFLFPFLSFYSNVVFLGSLHPGHFGSAIDYGGQYKSLRLVFLIHRTGGRFFSFIKIIIVNSFLFNL